MKETKQKKKINRLLQMNSTAPVSNPTNKQTHVHTINFSHHSEFQPRLRRDRDQSARNQIIVVCHSIKLIAKGQNKQNKTPKIQCQSKSLTLYPFVTSTNIFQYVLFNTQKKNVHSSLYFSYSLFHSLRMIRIQLQIIVLLLLLFFLSKIYFVF